MRIGILGCGSLGLLWGARLSKAGLETVLITRTEEQKNALLEKGLIFTSLKKEAERIPVYAETVSRALGQAPFDMVFVTVKQTVLPEIIPAIQRMTDPDSQILFWQNGLGHEKQIVRLRHRPWTYAAVTKEGAWKREKNEVRHTGAGETRMGMFPQTGGEPPAQFRSFIHILTKGMNEPDISIRYDSQVLRYMWEKLIINCVINPLTGLYEVRNGELLSGEYSEMMEQILKEALEVAETQGMIFEFAEMMTKVRSVCQKTAENYSSMLQDLQKGARTEIEFINGAVAEIGRKVHVNTPVNRRLVELIQAKEWRMA